MKQITIFIAALLLALVPAIPSAEAQQANAVHQKARFIVEPEVFMRHTAERSFIGPGMVVLENGEVLMAAPWGRPPTNFEQLAAKFPVPMLYRSADGGRTWKESGRMRMEWSLPGMVSDGGVSFLRLKDGRLAALLHRHVKDQHGGGLPAISFSKDDGATWAPARLVGEPEGVWYVMNERLIQLRSGRLLVPVAHMPKGSGLFEGDKNVGLCFFSDDGGETWQRSRTPARLDDVRGMAEPCVAEVGSRVLMLARTGSGFLFTAWSDDGGETWSQPAATTLESACSSLTLKTLPDGRLIVFYNHATPLKPGAFFPRTPLCYAVSDDGGKTWGSPVVVDDEGATNKDRQNIYPAACFTKEGMLVMWSTHQADPKGSFAGQYDAKIGGGKRAILALPTKAVTKTPQKASTIESDLCVYGGSSGGVVAAVQAARMGKRAVIVEPGKHLGGMTSGGLSAVDIGDPRTVGGIAREYFSRLVGRYGKKLEWDKPFVGNGGPATGGAYSIEPHVAEQVFNEMTREARVEVFCHAQLASVKKDGTRITELATADGTIFRAKMFVDATYEGDLMAKAGVSYTLLREGNAKYGEQYNGIHYTDKYKPRTGHQMPGASGRVKDGQGAWDRDFPLDPYVVKGDPTSGLLPLISDGDAGRQGDPAPGVQAYCFRLCLSTAADRLPIAPPPDYDAKRYEIVARFIEACRANGDDMDLRWFSKHDPLPNQKWDFNTATFGGNLPGASHEWPEATYARRVEIAKAHENYHRGLLHFLAADPRVPQKVRDDMKRFGLPKDEFTDNGGWPHQLYIREARRMVSDLVLTEHHTHGKQIAPHSIGLGSYGTDTHEVRRIVKDGVVTREGKTGGGRGGFGPYQIGYGAIVPKASECENLFVTFALSASHTAFSSIRMEPVFMVTSQSAATAACLAIDDAVPVQQVDQSKLRARLIADGQVLEATKPAPAKPQKTSATSPTKPLRIMPLGDSITRGSYLAQQDGKAIGLPHPMSGGWCKTLQDKLRAAGIAFDFVGELNYAAFGRDGVIDPQFDPDHHGLAGFSNAGIIKGGTVPTPVDVLAKLGVKEVKVPGIVDVLKKHQPDVILLMSGANGFDAPARDRLIRTIGETSDAHLFVATILPQKAPRAGWDKVAPYNASLSATVAAQQAADKRITLVDMHAAITTDDLLPDGVHPNQAGMEKMAATWFSAVQSASQSAVQSKVQSAASSPQQGIGHVIVPHSPEAARNGEASLIELRDGSLLLMYGAHQKTGDWDRGEIRQTRSRDGGKTWSEPTTVFRDEKRSLFQVAFARLAKGDIGLTHTSLANGRDAFKVFRRSTDDGQTWSEPLKISDASHDYTTGPWDKLYSLTSGRVIVLLHCNMQPNAKKQGGPLGVYTVYSDDNGKTWTRSPNDNVLHVADNPTGKHEWGFWEPSLVEHAPGKLLMMARTAIGWLWESRSDDNGSTWTPPTKTSIPNPLAPPVLTRIPNTETLVLIHNPDVNLPESWHGGARRVLAFRTSTDAGRTWSKATDIYRATEPKLWIDYPAARWIKHDLHLVWRHIENPSTAAARISLYHKVLSRDEVERSSKP